MVNRRAITAGRTFDIDASNEKSLSIDASEGSASASALLFSQYVSATGVDWQRGGQPLVLFITAVGYLYFLRQMARKGPHQATPLPAELRTVNRLIALGIGLFVAWFAWQVLPQAQANLPMLLGIGVMVLIFGFLLLRSFPPRNVSR
jgi:hypothetical protein